jgi:hypothetical protein
MPQCAPTQHNNKGKNIPKSKQFFKTTVFWVEIKEKMKTTR